MPHLRRKKILFIAEAVTLAQIVRLYVLARSLDTQIYEVAFASAAFPDLVFKRESTMRHFPIHSVAQSSVERAIDFGWKIYGKRQLQAYMREDLRIIDDFKPDVVIGDLRWSLAVSAPLRRVPLVSLINAYWSPWSTRANATPMPEHPIVRLIGSQRALQHYVRALPEAFASYAEPVNQLRVEAGLAPLGSLREMLCFGDRVAHPDIPEIAPTLGAPTSHVYLGHVDWAPMAGSSNWRDALTDQTPLVYVTLGSSGAAKKLGRVMEGLAHFSGRVVIATAGRARIAKPADNAFVTDFVPGGEVAARAAVVVSNGGSTTGYQALAQGTPVVGIARNMDQYLASQAIEGTGAGLTLRSGEFKPRDVLDAVERAIAEPNIKASAQAIATAFARLDSASRFSRLVDELV